MIRPRDLIKVICKTNRIQIVEFTKKGSEKVYTEAEAVPNVKVIIVQKGKTGKLILNNEYNETSTRKHKHSYKLCGGTIFRSIDDYVYNKKHNISIEHAAQTAAMQYAEEQLGLVLPEDAMEFIGIDSSSHSPFIRSNTYYFSVINYREGGVKKIETGRRISPVALTPTEIHELVLSGLFYEILSPVFLRYLHNGLGVKMGFGKITHNSGF